MNNVNNNCSRRYLIFDGNSLFHRAYHAYPHLTNSIGIETGAIYGFLSMFFKTLDRFYYAERKDTKTGTNKEIKTRIYICFDESSKDLFRKKIYSEYKANRSKMDEGLLQQFKNLKSILKKSNFNIFSKKGYEADDLILTVRNRILSDTKSKKNNTKKDEIEYAPEIYIFSGDRDLLQLITDTTKVVMPGKTFSDFCIYDERTFVSEWGFKPIELIEYKGIRGDTSDNIPGVRGIGEKGAKDLISKYGSIDNIYGHINEINGRIQRLLIEKKSDAYLSKELATIVQYEELKNIYKDKTISSSIFINEVHKLDIKKLDISISKYFNNGEQKICTKTECVEGFTKGFDGFKNGCLYLLYIKPNTDNVENMVFVDILEKTAKRVNKYYMGYSVKTFADTIDEAKCINKGSDGMISTFNVFVRNNDDIQVLDDSILNFDELKILLSLYGDLSIDFKKEEVDFKFLLNLFEVLLKKDSIPEINELFFSIERPLIPIILNLSKTGIKIDLDKLEFLKNEFSERIEHISNMIYKVVGHEFNISSNKQLQSIFFDELRLPVYKKNKKGYRIDGEYLKKYYDSFEICKLLLDYRVNSKLLTSYIIPLGKEVNKENSRIYSEFFQLGSITGRITSKSPSLQTIPSKGEYAKDIRNIFIADENMTFVSFDYSQIELRILAHLSNDKLLCYSFNNNLDVHEETAKLLFSKTTITHEERNIAKVINFSIIYGISAFSLSDDLGVSIDEANEFIQNYFKKYIGVKEYIDKAKNDVKTSGVTTSILGRKRWFDTKSFNSKFSQGILREAVNMPIQASNSDIIKKAMIEVDNFIKKKGNSAIQLVNQVHDELLFEIPENNRDELNKAINDIKYIMESVVTLKVPLMVKVKIGKRLGEME